MIPKKIHYVWLSDDPYPPLVQRCIDTWREKLPDYEIIHWNQSNFDVHMNKWCSQAFNEKKYAFVTDYARFYILYHHGGIYLDTDVEVLKNFDDLLLNSAFTSFTFRPGVIQGETIGCEQHHEMFGKILEYWESRNFINDSGELNQKIIDQVLYDIFISEGLCGNDNKCDQYISNVHIYPAGSFLMNDDLFYLSYGDGKKYLQFTESYSFHHSAGAWKGVSNNLHRMLREWYKNHFRFLFKIARYPFVLKFLQFGISSYRSIFLNEK